MFLIALTGGIAAGKSTIAARLAEHGAIVLDADQIAREAVSPSASALRELRATFGDKILTRAGELNRAELAKLVFGDEKQLQKLNSIVHPAVRSLARKKLDEIERATPDAIVVYDVPLLIEANVDHDWSLVVAAITEPAQQLKRLVSERNMTPSEAKNRISAQTTNAIRRERADVIIDTSGTMTETIRQTDELWERIVRTMNSQDEAKRATK